MVSIDSKASVRQQICGIKAEFEQLHKQSKITPEVWALMNGMLLIIELILSMLQERFTQKTYKNTSIRPSETTRRDDTTPGRNAKAGSFMAPR